MNLDNKQLHLIIPVIEYKIRFAEVLSTAVSSNVVTSVFPYVGTSVSSHVSVFLFSCHTDISVSYHLGTSVSSHMDTSVSSHVIFVVGFLPYGHLGFLPRDLFCWFPAILSTLVSSHVDTSVPPPPHTHTPNTWVSLVHSMWFLWFPFNKRSKATLYTLLTHPTIHK